VSALWVDVEGRVGGVGRCWFCRNCVVRWGMWGVGGVVGGVWVGVVGRCGCRRGVDQTVCAVVAAFGVCSARSWARGGFSVRCPGGWLVSVGDRGSGGVRWWFVYEGGAVVCRLLCVVGCGVLVRGDRRSVELCVWRGGGVLFVACGWFCVGGWWCRGGFVVGWPKGVGGRARGWVGVRAVVPRRVFRGVGGGPRGVGRRGALCGVTSGGCGQWRVQQGQPCVARRARDCVDGWAVFWPWRRWMWPSVWDGLCGRGAGGVWWS